MAFFQGSTKTLQGIAFPFSVSPLSVPATSEEAKVIIDSVKSLLFISTGEMPMEPGVGTDLHRFVFETIDGLALAQITSEVRKVIKKFEPRCDVLSVTLDTDNAIGGMRTGAIVNIEWQIGDETGEIPVPIDPPAAPIV